MDTLITCRNHRRFGVEVELNTLSGIVKTLNEDSGESPEGSDLVSQILSKTLHKTIEIHGWHTTNNNLKWIIKPDSSCGIEICSPVLKGWYGLRSLVEVVDALSKESKIRADKRCSFHVHINVSDLTKKQLTSIIAYYIKCEHVLFDCFPFFRKQSRYCSFLGYSHFFQLSDEISYDELLNKISGTKYSSCNTYHFWKGGGLTSSNLRKPTVEFRIADNEFCVDPFLVKNWVRFLLHFVETTKNLPVPKPYTGSPHTGLAWLDPKDVFKLLKFDQVLSPGMNQVKNWFISRLDQFAFQPCGSVNWGDEMRRVARNEYREIIESNDYNSHLDEDRETLLYDPKYVF